MIGVLDPQWRIPQEAGELEGRVQISRLSVVDRLLRSTGQARLAMLAHQMMSGSEPDLVQTWMQMTYYGQLIRRYMHQGPWRLVQSVSAGVTQLARASTKRACSESRYPSIIFIYCVLKQAWSNRLRGPQVTSSPINSTESKWDAKRCEGHGSRTSKPPQY
jgi:hypothetical protein